MFVIFSKGVAGHSNPSITYAEGENTVAKWDPSLVAMGGYFCTTITYLENIPAYTNGATHVWTVRIPDDEHRISLGAWQIKSARIIMSDMRPVADLLRPLPAQHQTDIYRSHPELMKRLGISYTPEMIESVKPSKVSSVGVVDVYSNGLHITRMPDNTFIGTFTRDVEYLRHSSPAGTTFTCAEFRDGHAYGASVWTKPCGFQASGTLTHTTFNGPGTAKGRDVIFTWGRYP